MYQNANTLWPLGGKPAQAYCGEDARLTVLAAHGMAALVDDPELAQLISLAAEICEAPMAMVSVVEQQRQLFLSRLGLEATETPRSSSFCAHAMLGNQVMVVCDATRDERFTANPLVTGEPGIRFYAGQPLISSEGAPLGSLCVIDTVPRPAGLSALQLRTLETLGLAVMRRLASQRQHTAHTAEQERAQKRVRQVLDSFPGVAWSADASLNFDFFNARWPEWTGLPAPTTVDEWAAAIHPDDYARSRVEFEAAVARGDPFEDEIRLRRANGDWQWTLSRVVPIDTLEGERRWVGTLIDIDREHRQREANDLLANELSHRIKNIFAVVSGLISIRARGRAEVADFAGELNAVVRALGTAHDYVRPGEWRQSDCLQRLLADLLAPYDTGDSRVRIVGDDLAIGLRAATPLALIFHELATNSAKYGALSVPGGRIEVTIGADLSQDDTVRVTWHETGIPERDQHEPAHEGFGSRLLRMAIESQLGGSFERRFENLGTRIDIALPRASVTG